MLGLLSRFDVHPLVAVRPESDVGAVAAALNSVAARGLEPGIWPLLSLEEGYWPSERNLGPWRARVFELLDALEEHRAHVAWLAVDLEPPIGQISRLLRNTLALPFAAVELAAENMDLARFLGARRELDEAVRTIGRRGVQTLGVTLPFAAHDLRDGVPVWQDMCETPWATISWDAAGIMAYGSMVAGASRGVLRAADARAVHQPLLDHLARHWGSRAHASLGVTGTGIFGDEPTYDDPEQLALDVSAARAAGIDDIALFCLEGILAQRAPERWLETFDAAPRIPPTTLRARAVRALATAGRVGTRVVFRR